MVSAALSLEDVHTKYKLLASHLLFWVLQTTKSTFAGKSASLTSQILLLPRQDVPFLLYLLSTPWTTTN